MKNALFAAAPEMYALLEEIVEIVETASKNGLATSKGNEVMRRGKDILKKARGE